MHNCITRNTCEKSAAINARLPMKYIGSVVLLMGDTPNCIGLAFPAKVKCLTFKGLWHFTPFPVANIAEIVADITNDNFVPLQPYLNAHTCTSLCHNCTALCISSKWYGGGSESRRCLLTKPLLHFSLHPSEINSLLYHQNNGQWVSLCNLHNLLRNSIDKRPRDCWYKAVPRSFLLWSAQS